MQTTTVHIDWGAIIMALSPSLVIIVTAIIATFTYRRTRQENKERYALEAVERDHIARKAAADAAEIKQKTDDMYVLVDGHYTQQVMKRLEDLEAFREILSVTIGDEPSERQREALATIDRQIEQLRIEITKREAVTQALAEDSGQPSVSSTHVLIERRKA